MQVKTSEPVNPGDLYGVTKCFGEALGRYMATQEDVDHSGAHRKRVPAAEERARRRACGCSTRSCRKPRPAPAIERSIDAGEIRFAVFHGLSDNRFSRLDISDARELLGYQPQDDLTEENVKLRGLKLDDKVQAHSMQDASQKSGIREEARGMNTGRVERPTAVTNQKLK